MSVAIKRAHRPQFFCNPKKWATFARHNVSLRLADRLAGGGQKAAKNPPPLSLRVKVEFSSRRDYRPFAKDHYPQAAGSSPPLEVCAELEFFGREQVQAEAANVAECVRAAEDKASRQHREHNRYSVPDRDEQTTWPRRFVERDDVSASRAHPFVNSFQHVAD